MNQRFGLLQRDAWPARVKPKHLVSPRVQGELPTLKIEHALRDARELRELLLHDVMGLGEPQFRLRLEIGYGFSHGLRPRKSNDDSELLAKKTPCAARKAEHLWIGNRVLALRLFEAFKQP